MSKELILRGIKNVLDVIPFLKYKELKHDFESVKSNISSPDCALWFV